ncbi:MAG: AMP-binding protein [Nocardioides sp.]
MSPAAEKPHLVTDLVALAAARDGARAALVEPSGRRLTWADLDTEVGRVAAGLGRVGVVAGQRVLLVMGNRIELVTTYLGALRAQLVAVPANPRSKVEELAWMIADSGARLVVAEAATVADVRAASVVVREAGQRPPVVVVVDSEPQDGELGFDDVRAEMPTNAPTRPDPETLACLLYTGTTADLPRAAMLTHRALLANLEQAAAVEPPMMRGEDVVLGVLPLFHVYGLNAVLGGVIRQGATLVLADHFDPRGTLDVIADQAVTVVPVAPAVFPHWLGLPDLSASLGSVRLVLSGSAPLSRGVVEAFQRLTGIPVHQGYGLTEAAPVVTSTLASATPAPGSLGVALPGVGLRLADDLGLEPEPGDPGEIQIRGDNLFAGYWPDGTDGPGVDGWWATGDVGFLDDDGDLFLVDRAAEVVVVAGFSVYPSEVEEVVGRAAGVEDVAVTGVPDDVTGSAVVAYVRAPGADPATVVDDVRRRCEAELAGFKRPTRIEVVAELPTSLAGRVRKGALRQLERRRALGILE